MAELTEERSPPSLVKEIIIENFMSYEYARIPLRPGLNIICGPNGSGKSSILLALAVALGQTYTERSRRLTDLIRRGRDMARVTVVFENATKNGRKPIPGSKYDEFILSRYLSRSGTYWYEADHRAVTKEEVLRTLSKMGIDPDNMLIVMHQNMTDVFSALDAKEKLKLVEEAVGLREYRQKVLEANERLAHTLSEKESVDRLLERAQETLAHWQGEYERYLKKRDLLKHKERLEVEYAWSKHKRQESIIEGILARIGHLQDELEGVERDLRGGGSEVERGEVEIERLEHELDAVYQDLIVYERERAERLARLDLLEVAEKLSQRGLDARDALREMWGETGFDSPTRASNELTRLDGKVQEAKEELVRLKKKLSEKRGKYVDARVKVALIMYKRDLLNRELSSLRSNMRRERRLLEESRLEAEKIGPRVETERNPQEVLDEIRVRNAQLASLEDVSVDAEKMYSSYKNLLEELKKRAEITSENRRRALEELGLRTARWRSTLNELLLNVGSIYRRTLNSIGADGEVRVVNVEDVDNAGIELRVGFRGELTVLDAYTHSGGERAASILCFLLALQKHVKSPIRAIDEFDIHMDPRNREEMMSHLLRLMVDEIDQYLVITPRELTDVEEVPNIITVQNTRGASKVTVAV